MKLKDALTVVAGAAVYAASVVRAYDKGRADEQKRQMRLRMDGGKRQTQLAAGGQTGIGKKRAQSGQNNG